MPDAELRPFLQERGLPAVDGRTDLSGQSATPDGTAVRNMPDHEAPDTMEGTGTVELAPGSFPAQIAGAHVTQAFFASSTPRFRDGTLQLP